MNVCGNEKEKQELRRLKLLEEKRRLLREIARLSRVKMVCAGGCGGGLYRLEVASANNERGVAGRAA